MADCVAAALAASGARRRNFELAGPETLSYDEIVRAALRPTGARRPLLHVPLPIARRSLVLLRRLVGPRVFATWDEAELMEEPMTTPRGTTDAESLGVRPLAMASVLGGG